MGKHGTQKKRRRGLKVSRKPSKHRAVRIANSVTHSHVKALYDKNKTPEENLAAMGLVSDVNEKLNADSNILNCSRNGSSSSGAANPPPQHAAFVGYGDRVTGEIFVEPNPKRKVLSEFDAEFARRNIEKHGSDYQAMQRDIKINDRQYTFRQMQKLCEKYLALNQ